MVSSPDRDVILLSIEQCYAEAIMDGRKTVEFRRAPIASSVRFVVVYACAPVKKVIGYFEVAGTTIGTPNKLWRKYEKAGCIARDAFIKYYIGKENGVCIHIRKAWRFQPPFALSRIRGFNHPPQSFRYVNNRDWRLILKRNESATRLPDNAND